MNFMISNNLSFAVTKGLCQAANVLHSHKCMSYGSNFRRTDYFRNTGNWWDPHGGSKPWSWLARTKKTHSTDFACQQLHLNHVVTTSLKNIDERKIRILLDNLVYSFLEVKLQRLWRKRYEGKLISVLYSQTVLITVYGGVKIQEVTRR